MTEKTPEELQKEIDKLKAEKKERDWDMFWEKYNAKYPNSKKMMDNFLDEIQKSYSQIATQNPDELTETVPYYNNSFSMWRGKKGAIQGSQLAFLFLGRMVNFSVRESLKAVEAKYLAKIQEVDKLEKEVKKLKNFRKEYLKYLRTGVEPKSWK